MTIPEGYMLVPKEQAEEYMWVPKKLVEQLFSDHGWQKIQEPTITETAEYLKISLEKIKKDLRKINCPLRKVSKGGKGRGNQITFIKSSVEIYKDWIKSK